MFVCLLVLLVLYSIPWLLSLMSLEKVKLCTSFVVSILQQQQQQQQQHKNNSSSNSSSSSSSRKRSSSSSGSGSRSSSSRKRATVVVLAAATAVVVRAVVVAVVVVVLASVAVDQVSFYLKIDIFCVFIDEKSDWCRLLLGPIKYEPKLSAICVPW